MWTYQTHCLILSVYKNITKIHPSYNQLFWSRLQGELEPVPALRSSPLTGRQSCTGHTHYGQSAKTRSPNCTFLDYRRMLKYMEEAHSNTGRTQNRIALLIPMGKLCFPVSSMKHTGTYTILPKVFGHLPLCTHEL